jgi:hypothetical protein
VRVMGVALAAVTGVQQPCPGGQLGRHIEHVFAGLQQPLRQRPGDSHATKPDTECSGSNHRLSGAITLTLTCLPVLGRNYSTRTVTRS